MPRPENYERITPYSIRASSIVRGPAERDAPLINHIVEKYWAAREAAQGRCALGLQLEAASLGLLAFGETRRCTSPLDRLDAVTWSLRDLDTDEVEVLRLRYWVRRDCFVATVRRNGVLIDETRARYLGYDEIAERMSTSIARVKALITSARAKIAERVALEYLGAR